jgi:hypothetical protein
MLPPTNSLGVRLATAVESHFALLGSYKTSLLSRLIMRMLMKVSISINLCHKAVPSHFAKEKQNLLLYQPVL